MQAWPQGDIQGRTGHLTFYCFLLVLFTLPLKISSQVAVKFLLLYLADEVVVG